MPRECVYLLQNVENLKDELLLMGLIHTTSVYVNKNE